MNLIVRYLGLIEYAVTFEQMRRFAGARDASCADEIWCLEHPPVFTQGQGGRADHVHDTKDIPIVRSDRGGQVTYHGPGQLVVYVLIAFAAFWLSVHCIVFTCLLGFALYEQESWRCRACCVWCREAVQKRRRIEAVLIYPVIPRAAVVSTYEVVYPARMVLTAEVEVV